MDERERTTEGLGEIKRTRSFDWSVILALVVAVARLLFIVQNTDSTEVSWLFFDGSAPLWLLLVITAALGAVLFWVVSMFVRRRRRG